MILDGERDRPPDQGCILLDATSGQHGHCLRMISAVKGYRVKTLPALRIVARAQADS